MKRLALAVALGALAPAKAPKTYQTSKAKQ